MFELLILRFCLKGLSFALRLCTDVSISSLVFGDESSKSPSCPLYMLFTCVGVELLIYSRYDSSTGVRHMSYLKSFDLIRFLSSFSARIWLGSCIK